MLWEVEIIPRRADAESERVCREHELLTHTRPATPLVERSARGFLLEGELRREQAELLRDELLVDALAEMGRLAEVGVPQALELPDGRRLRPLATVLLKPGLMDPAAQRAAAAARYLQVPLAGVRTFRRYYAAAAAELAAATRDTLFRKVLANEAIEQVIEGPLRLEHLTLGSSYQFRRVEVPIR